MSLKSPRSGLPRARATGRLLSLLLAASVAQAAPPASPRARANAPVNALLDRAAADRDAATALAACSPAACAPLADALNESFDARHVQAYEALCAILHEKSPKSARFWEKADLAAKRAETARVRDRARRAAGQP
ncbi:hypothetical protein RAS1_25440 [Phycisphaerae bacterium RAS1]|nr:hypothetical protein RAS1_25440 [Phycisphaerae bacterium RAS1]